MCFIVGLRGRTRDLISQTHLCALSQISTCSLTNFSQNTVFMPLFHIFYTFYLQIALESYIIVVDQLERMIKW
jgi:hypothetical protein